MLILHSTDFTACCKHFLHLDVTPSCYTTSQRFSPDRGFHSSAGREHQKIHRRGRWLQESLPAAADAHAESQRAAESRRSTGALHLGHSGDMDLPAEDTQACATPTPFTHNRLILPVLCFKKKVTQHVFMQSLNQNYLQHQLQGAPLLVVFAPSERRTSWGPIPSQKFEEAESSTLSNPSAS